MVKLWPSATDDKRRGSQQLMIKQWQSATADTATTDRHEPPANYSSQHNTVSRQTSLLPTIPLHTTQCHAKQASSYATAPVSSSLQDNRLCTSGDEMQHNLHHIIMSNEGRGQFKCDVTHAETSFRLSTKRTSPFKSAGRQFSRLLAAEVCASAVVMLDTPCSEVV